MTALAEVRGESEVVKKPSAHRADIQGLRAVAVLSVLLYHTKLGPHGGFIGVDVFFVISGFLITGLLLREHERSGRISLPAFWGRRARRLLPSGVLVIVLTCLASWAFLPAARWSGIGGDAIAAAGYALNWRLAHESIDYLDANNVAGPLQHYWSLAIEEQFYLVWPLLLGLTMRVRRRPRAVTAVVVAVVFAVSLTLSLTVDSPTTYFTTQTRAWELAAGALVAVAIRRIDFLSDRVPALAAGLSWIGLALIGVSLWLVTSSSWPGPLTPLVIGATALTLAFGQAERGARLVLALPFMTWFGDISYPLYLWHWPLVVLADRNGILTTRESVAIVVVSIVLSWLTHVLLERPVLRAKRFSAPRVSLIGGLVLSLVAAGAGFALMHAHSVKTPDHIIGASAPVTLQKSADALAPRPEDAQKDLADLYSRGCEDNYQASDVRPCVSDFGTSASSPVVVGVGDSKMAQWTPTLEEIARQKHWKFISLTKSSCPFSDVHRTIRLKDYTSCDRWNQNVLAYLRDNPPTLLVSTELDYFTTIVNGKILDGAPNRAEMIRGQAARINEVKALGIPVVTLAETPHMKVLVPDCVSQHFHDLAACARSRSRAMQDAGVMTAAARQSGGVPLDLTDHFCTPTVCPAVTGNVLIYWDNLHMTATYARTLVPYFLEDLTKAFDPGMRKKLGLP